METVILECGHSANATDGNGQPACAIHSTAQGGTTPVRTAPDLTARQARCSCGSTANSSTGLAFFEYLGDGSRDATELCLNCGSGYVTHLEVNPSTGRAGHKFGVCEFTPKGDVGYDRYYCGCRGWD
jgi:hypothetical protein